MLKNAVWRRCTVSEGPSDGRGAARTDDVVVQVSQAVVSVSLMILVRTGKGGFYGRSPGGARRQSWSFSWQPPSALLPRVRGWPRVGQILCGRARWRKGWPLGLQDASKDRASRVKETGGRLDVPSPAEPGKQALRSRPGDPGCDPHFACKHPPMLAGTIGSSWGIALWNRPASSSCTSRRRSSRA